MTESNGVPGPIDFILLEFPDQRPTGVVAAELMALVDAGIIAIYDIVAVRKTHDGTVSGFEISDLGGGEIGFAAFAGARSGLLGDDDVSGAGEIIQPGTIAVLLVYENLWARGFVAAALSVGGSLVAAERIPAEDVIAALDALDAFEDAAAAAMEGEV